MSSAPQHSLYAAPELTPRAELPYRAAALVGLGTHVGLLGLFAFFEIWPMVAFNVGSIALFVLVYVLVRKNRVGPGMILALGEVIVHQIVAFYYTGWTPGFQYYITVVVPLPLMLPDVPTKRRLVFASVPALVFIALLVLPGVDPSHPFPEPVAVALGRANLLISFAAPWLFVFYFRRGAELAEDALDRARQRTEQLLFGILPPAIVGRLREGELVADSFDDVSILFCDIVGFTSLAQEVSPEQLVRMLDEIFAGFDDLVEERGLEKIKTIGDAYMVAAGVPEPVEGHAERLAELALAIRERIRADAAKTGRTLALRLGMHRGGAVAGVIGKSKFAYDIWGDAVNTAARMESHGQPDRIHISAAMAEALRERFVVESRGSVEIKGKGAMETFWLVAARERA